MYEAVGPGICERDEWKLDLDWRYCCGSLSSFPYGLFDVSVQEILSNHETTSPAKANGEWLGQPKHGANAAEDAPIITDNHVTASATAASLHFLGCSEAGSLHSPFPFLEAARTERPMAPAKERTSRAENAMRLRTRLGSASRRLYFNMELGRSTVRGNSCAGDVTYKQRIVNRTMMSMENCKASLS